MSFTYSSKKSGPETEPCGTPYHSLPGEENSSPLLTEANLFVRYDLNHDITDLKNLK